MNIIAEKLRLRCESLFNKTSFLGDYLDYCDYELKASLSGKSRIITSDDIFAHILSVRKINGEIDNTEVLFERYSDNRRKSFGLILWRILNS